MAGEDFKIKIPVEADTSDLEQLPSKAGQIGQEASQSLNEQLVAQLELDVTQYKQNLDLATQEYLQFSNELKSLTSSNARALGMESDEYERQVNLTEELKETALSSMKEQQGKITQTEWQIKKINKDIEETKKWVKGVGEETDKATEKTWWLEKAWSKIKALWILTVFATIWKKIIDLWSDAQQAQNSFTTMLGDAEQAQIMLSQLSDFAKNTPFELQWIRESAQQLLAMWVDTTEVIPTLKALWDVSAWLWVDLDRLAMNYGQVQTQTKLTWTELKDFQKMWVPLLSELAKNLNKSEAEIQNMVSAGKIGANDVKQAFQTMTSEWWKFANMMETQSKTLAWQMSNFKDTLGQIWEQIGLSVIPFLQDMMWELTQATDDFDEMGWSWVSASQMIAYALAAILTWISALIKAIQTVGKVAGNFIGNVVIGVQAMAKDISSIFSQLIHNTKDVFAAFGNNIMVGVKKWVNWAISALNTMVDWANKIPWVNIGHIDKMDTGEYQTVFKDLFKETKLANEAMTQNNQDTIEDIIGDWSDWWSSIKQNFADIKNNFKNTQWTLKSINAKTNADIVSDNKKWAGATKKTAEQLAKEQIEIQKKQLEQQRDEDIKFAQETIKDKDQLASRILKINEDYEKAVQELDWKTTEQIIKNAQKTKDELKKTTDEAADKVIDYWEKIKKVGEKWEEMAKTAKDSIQSVNKELKNLDTDLIGDLSERYAEVKKDLEDMDFDTSNFKRIYDRYSKSEVESWTKDMFGEESKDDILKYYDLMEELEILNWKLTEQQKQQAVDKSKETETLKIINEYEAERNSLIEKRAMLTAEAESEAGKNPYRINKDENWDIKSVEYYNKDLEARQEIQDQKNQEYAISQANKYEEMQNELAEYKQNLSDQLNTLIDFNTACKTMYDEDTKAYKKELDKKLQATADYVASVKEMLASIPSSYRAYWWSMTKWVAYTVGENWPEQVVARQSSYVQPRNAVQNYSTQTTNNSNLNIGGIDVWSFATIEDMIDWLREYLTYKH